MGYIWGYYASDDIDDFDPNDARDIPCPACGLIMIDPETERLCPDCLGGVDDPATYAEDEESYFQSFCSGVY